jgi:hypothetical protein
MGLMDRLKETAQEVASEARKAGSQAQGKLEEIGMRRSLDDSAKQLGYLVYRERTQGTPAGSDADALVDRMRKLEEDLERQRDAAAGAPEADDGGERESSSAQAEGDLMEETQPGAAPPQSPPEGRPTDQDS